jgi:hypothetical protein
VQIGRAMHSYHIAYGAFPPAVFTDKHNGPKQSWRVAILPYCGQSTLYGRYDRTKPWNSPENLAVASTAISLFRCPGDPNETASPMVTNYVRVVGKNTVGGLPNEAVKIGDVTDGTSCTIMVVEVCGLDVKWTEPRDVTVEEFMDIVARSAAPGGTNSHAGGFHAVMADGSVHFISNTLSPKTLRALLLRNDGQTINSSDY